MRSRVYEVRSEVSGAVYARNLDKYADALGIATFKAKQTTSPMVIVCLLMGGTKPVEKLVDVVLASGKLSSVNPHYRG